MPDELVLPQTHDRDTEPYFDAARQGKLVVKVCNNCGNGLHPPTPDCPFCGSHNTEWKEASGRGTLYTWTTVTHSIHPSFPAPYVIVVVQLDDIDRVRLVGHMPGEHPELYDGMPMKVVFDRLDSDVVQPNWVPA